MGNLLMAMGQLEEARPLLEEALQAKRETLGDRHPSTLISIYNMGDLLETQGSLAEAIPLFTEELEGLVVLRGMEFQETRDSAKHLVELLRSSGQLDEAEALAARHGVSLNGWAQGAHANGAKYWWRARTRRSQAVVEINLTDPEV